MGPCCPCLARLTPMDLPQIERQVRDLAARIRAPDGLLPTYGRTQDGARPHVEVDDAGFHFVVVERGEELERATFADVDGLLERIFESVTFSMAMTHKPRFRFWRSDPRRAMFARQVQLLGILSPEWADREAREHQAILARHPFDDAADARADLAVKLRARGQSDDEAWRNACLAFPLPPPG